jgi:hypothetical protein
VARASSQVGRRGGVRCLQFIASNDANPTKEPIMTNRTHTLIQRATALALAASVTAAMLAAVNGLASRDIAPDSLLAQQSTSRPA